MKYTKQELIDVLTHIDSAISAYEKSMKGNYDGTLDLAEMQAHIESLDCTRTSIERMLEQGIFRA